MSTDQAGLYLHNRPNLEVDDRWAELSQSGVLLFEAGPRAAISLIGDWSAASSDVDHWTNYDALSSRIIVAGEESGPLGYSPRPVWSDNTTSVHDGDIFISHSSADEERVRQLIDNLNRIRYRVFHCPDEASMSIYVDLRDAGESAIVELFSGSQEWLAGFGMAGRVVSAEPRTVAHREAYKDRISDLREFAGDDEEIERVNEDSIRDFWAFMESTAFARRAGLVLQDNGNLRAVWRDKDGNNVGLEFQGNGSILYVMFKPYTDGRKTFRKQMSRHLMTWYTSYVSWTCSPL